MCPACSHQDVCYDIVWHLGQCDVCYIPSWHLRACCSAVSFGIAAVLLMGMGMLHSVRGLYLRSRYCNKLLDLQVQLAYWHGVCSAKMRVPHDGKQFGCSGLLRWVQNHPGRYADASACIGLWSLHGGCQNILPAHQDMQACGPTAALLLSRS